ncbi:thiolase C-terminal domain-containing protein [Mycolicibacterium holsaticum]|uniref:thiolase C-terminal domain-containing protein n=1 Tax=Mycolicibacterium holsaticum TaxID=152142 RepID=UPI001C7E0286|nr:lipid-transfer protein [Mycolicibacterium holsaticum]MDA4108128.1 lipid-transfer protein [Mycolicibacterium holsaticum DSM 44478 = JCM 12374]QZA14460.1 lipid-transfer protein [Mycolicibacterium holsaticum DSM 44478 = JCM 12374]UNC08091.1 lipid-transfer protein [Mycolicibacterium holsaticum DSM 44478 = JCM 12374]
MGQTAPHPLRDRCAIVGIGATDFTRKSGRTEVALAAAAGSAAIADAGMSPADIDGIVRCEQDTVRHNDLADALGLPALTYWGSTGTGGSAPAGMVAQACAAIASGLARSVLVFRSLNGRSGARFGQARRRQAAVGGNGSYDEFFLPYGLLAPGQMFALIARRHMIEYGTQPTHLGAIAVACREHANANPAAQMYGRPMSLSDYLGARPITEPLRLYDYCLETDGACAVVVTSAERARDTPAPPVSIRAVAQSADPAQQPGLVFGALMRASLTEQPSARTAELLYHRAGLGPEDVDVAQLYDCFTITVLLQLEGYGFAPKGDGGPFAASGALRVGGALPVNTAGGNLSEGYLHGLNHVVEGVRQIRGCSTNQVPDAEVCLVTSGLPTATGALLLTAAR